MGVPKVSGSPTSSLDQQCRLFRFGTHFARRSLRGGSSRNVVETQLISVWELSLGPSWRRLEPLEMYKTDRTCQNQDLCLVGREIEILEV